MKGITTEGCLHFVASIFILNVIFSLRSFYYFFFTSYEISDWENILNIILLVISSSFTVIGFFVNLCIWLNEGQDVLDKDTNTTTITVDGTSSNMTYATFFGNFSLLALTGFSIPVNNSWLSISLYLIVLVAIGILYIRLKLYYINPLLLIAGYYCYKIESNGRELIIFSLVKIEGEKDISYYDVNQGIIIIKDKKSVKEHERSDKDEN